MTTFPLNPTNGLTHSINDRVWSWNGYAWEKLTQSGSGGGGTSGVSSFAGFTGDVAAGVATNEILYHDGSSINGSGDFTFDGTDVVLGGQGHFEGFFDGPLQKDIKADEALAAGDPVYITGNVGSSNRVTVAKSDASDPLKMPAAGIVSSAFSTNQEGVMTLVGTIKSFDTSAYTANNELYVSPGGGLTASRPTGSSHLVQKIVRVGRVHASTGTIMVHGAGRANDVPNLVHARAGISSDAGITVGGEIRTTNGKFYNSTSDTGIDVSSASQANIRIGGSARWQVSSSQVSTPVKLITTGEIEARSRIQAEAGISMDAAGITFPDGTFQSTAAAGGTGYIAGAGLTLDAAGGTFSIDPTALIHVNGVSSDAGITSGSIIYAKGNIYSDGNVLVPNGSRFGNAANGVFRVATSELQLLPNNSTTNAFVAAASLHYHNQKTQFKAGISADAGITANAPCNFLDNQVIRPQLKDYSETVNAIGSKTTSFSVDFEDGNVQSLTVGGNMTVSFTNAPGGGEAGTVTLVITNGGAHTVTWPSGFQTVKWPGGVAPSLTSSGTDILTFLTTDAGVTIYGFVGGLNFS